MSITTYQFFHRLRHLPFVEAIWIYGSRARGDASEKSDIDLAIVCPEASQGDWHKVLEIIETADTFLKVDCIRFDELSDADKLKKNISTFKKILYQKGSNYMDKEFWKDYFESLGEALNRLKEVVYHPQVDQVDYLQDAAIQRFEFCVELYWKVLKKVLAYEKIESTTPRDVLQKAYQFQIIEDEKLWMAMMDDRNKTSHVYKQEEAQKVFQNIKAYYPLMAQTYATLAKKYFSKR